VASSKLPLRKAQALVRIDFARGVDAVGSPRQPDIHEHDIRRMHCSAFVFALLFLLVGAALVVVFRRDVPEPGR